MGSTNKSIISVILLSLLVLIILASPVTPQLTESVSGVIRSFWEKNGTAIYNTNTGNVGIGTQDPQFKLHVLGDVAWTGILQAGFIPWANLINFPAPCPPGEFVTSIGSSITCSAPPSSGGNVSGTAGYIAKFGSSNALEDSAIYESNGNIGIGTTNLTGRFQVYSNNLSSVNSSAPSDPASSMLFSSGLVSFSATNAVDNNVGTNAWHTDSSSAGAWLMIDLGAGNSQDYVKARLYSAGSGNNAVYSVQFSDDGINWTTAAAPFTTGLSGWNEKMWNPVGAHRLWRLLLTNTPGFGTWMTELEMYALTPPVHPTVGNALLVQESGDVTIAGGLILQAIDGLNCFKIFVDTIGNLQITPTNCII